MDFNEKLSMKKWYSKTLYIYFVFLNDILKDDVKLLLDQRVENKFSSYLTGLKENKLRFNNMAFLILKQDRYIFTLYSKCLIFIERFFL